MAQQDAIQKARDVIGDAEDTDYIIQPTAHAELYSSKAPSLATILKSGSVAALSKQYERFDKEASAGQASFLKTARRANAASFLTVLFGTGILLTAMAPDALPSQIEKYAALALGIAVVIAGGFGSRLIHGARSGGLLEDWMGSRAKAETRRTEYFTTVVDATADGAAGDQMPLPLLQLEYFRRYQLDVQFAYYTKRAAEHKRSGRRLLSLSGNALLLASLVAGVAGVLAGAVDARWAAMAALGMICTAFSSYASTAESINQDRRKSESYARTRDALEAMQAKLDEVRRAVASGSREALTEFVKQVQDLVSVEHRQWLASAEQIKSAVDGLGAAPKP